MTTIGIITEQIQQLYKRVSGNFDKSAKQAVDRREVRPLIVQVANTLLQAKAQGALQLGDISYPPCTMITFDALPVTTVAGRQVATLPAYPLPLVRDIGVWSVVPMTGGIEGPAYVPITSGDWDLLQGTAEALLEGQTGFYLEGKTLVFTPVPAPAATVKAKLLVSDISTLTDSDVLPCSPDIESAIITGVVELLAKTTIPKQPDFSKEEKN